MQEFDLVVIGSGPAGYTGSIRAAQLGLKVACIEKNDTLGGTCLNIGCIPSKALLNTSKKYEETLRYFENIGIIADTKLDLQKMLSNKDKIVLDLTKGIESLFVKNKVTKIKGEAKIISNNIVEVNKEHIKASNILIATGSSVIGIPTVIIDEEFIVSSTGALKLSKVPEHLIVVGGGYIGLELGSVWRRLGSKVTVIEYASSIVPMLDKEIAKQFMTIQQKQGIKFKLNTKVVASEVRSGKVNLTIEEADKRSIITSDVVLIAVGRKAYTKNLGFESIGITTDNQGRIEINEYFQTAVSNIYAVGDVVKGAMLAHKAEEEAIAAVEIIAGQAGHVNYNLIPSVIYTYPEVASVGATEQQLQEQGIHYKVGKFPFLANSRARAIGSTEGMVKILADSKTDRVLGAHIIGSDAGTLIAELIAYMEFGASTEDIARTCHAHPTLSEAIKEAALSVDKRTINI
ncbi:dihydrolipoyl dehydrogenase [Rickettsia typhi]|uniref:Dihydrolipoyl dehydrogenase n=2 Tax=Rickettsia typhi TaxID=785 RepID=Q68WR9_RICTY|nr:dihydrolipoyl dehydrogenase [Rickettsia typhi]AAU03923.1 Diaphorase [Rickettsia typhi str. Wilmington]AFE54304.1 dihydrolipoamide dehydrogenase [Rickettsia typhi str. TH1527]AFE55144.1 dihydrolipoamide dehydrogenase [Rickettsia typhi str. B9991CWPP]